nr:ribonuclease H-like domain-containing protein [Tanacetum cinerariifolium]
FLRSLPSDWRTHTLIWRNKTDLEEQNLDDLFNSLKIYEAEAAMTEVFKQKGNLPTMLLWPSLLQVLLLTMR